MVQWDTVDPPFGKRRLDLPRTAHAVAVEGAQVHPPQLIEAESPGVVVGDGKPEAAVSGGRGVLATHTWVNRRYDARSVDDPGYTDTVREDFDRTADHSEAEGWDRRVVMGPRRPGCR
jgi:hypothetical protein